MRLTVSELCRLLALADCDAGASGDALYWNLARLDNGAPNFDDLSVAEIRRLRTLGGSALDVPTRELLDRLDAILNNVTVL